MRTGVRASVLVSNGIVSGVGISGIMPTISRQKNDAMRMMGEEIVVSIASLRNKRMGNQNK